MSEQESKERRVCCDLEATDKHKLVLTIPNGDRLSQTPITQ